MNGKIMGLFVCMLMLLTSLCLTSVLAATENKISLLDAEITIAKPNRQVYVFNMQIAPLPIQGRFNAIVIGMVDVELEILDPLIDTVEFYVDDELVETISEEPYSWLWNEKMVVPPIRTLKVVGYANDTEIGSDEISVLYINLFSRP